MSQADPAYPKQKRRSFPPIKPGDRFGQLTAVEPAGMTAKRHTQWLFRCDCGTEKPIVIYQVRYGDTVSCGCVRREKALFKSKDHPRHGLKHGLSTRPEYTVWKGMRRRCLDASDPAYPYYGGRGITVCERWRADFGAFFADMGPRPGRGFSIERMRNNGNYEPGNCRWATAKEQSSNQRSNVIVAYAGQTMTLSEAARRAGLKIHTVDARLRYGWSIERALSEPPRPSSRYQK